MCRTHGVELMDIDDRGLESFSFSTRPSRTMGFVCNPGRPSGQITMGQQETGTSPHWYSFVPRDINPLNNSI